ncbi:MAG: pseudouridine-5'-phosphate glycosidase [Limnochordales bacterium]
MTARSHSVPLVLTEEVQEALAAGQAVVALESSIIAQGMPHPTNIETALKVEETIRQRGAVPATTALLDGKIRVGLSAGEIERLGTAKDAVKVGRRDLARALVTKAAGGTTVSATSTIAALAGIRTFATGGIGGVHRGWTGHLDVSADLRAIAMARVTVVCSGAKAFLDLPATLEVLESLAVAVVGFRTDVFPSFYSRETDLALEHRADSAEEIARQMACQDQLGLPEGMVVVNPIPADAEIPRAEIEGLIERALREAEEQGIAGKAVTPFVLERVKQLSGGRSLAATVALVVNTAQVAADIAVAYSKLAAGGA